MVRAASARALLPARLSAHTCVHTEYETDAVLKLKRLDTPRYVLHTHVSTHTYLTHTHAHTHTHGCTRARTHTQYLSCILQVAAVLASQGRKVGLLDVDLCGTYTYACIDACVRYLYVHACVYVHMYTRCMCKIIHAGSMRKCIHNMHLYNIV